MRTLFLSKYNGASRLLHLDSCILSFTYLNLSFYTNCFSLVINIPHVLFFPMDCRFRGVMYNFVV